MPELIWKWICIALEILWFLILLICLLNLLENHIGKTQGCCFDCPLEKPTRKGTKEFPGANVESGAMALSLVAHVTLTLFLTITMRMSILLACSIALNDPGNLQKEVITGDLMFQKVRICHHHLGEHGNSHQACMESSGMILEWELSAHISKVRRGREGSLEMEKVFWNFKAHSQWHTSSSKVIAHNPS